MSIRDSAGFRRRDFTRQQHKDNLMRLVRCHRKECEGRTCEVSLFMLRDLCDALSIELTPAEKGELI